MGTMGISLFLDQPALRRGIKRRRLWMLSAVVRGGFRGADISGESEGLWDWGYGPLLNFKAQSWELTGDSFVGVSVL